MNERNSLQKVFEGILSSQSFELLRDFSDDKSWATLQQDEKDLLAQLFLLNAEKIPCAGESEQRRHAKKSYRAACSLSPMSARVWYHLGAFLALSEEKQELHEALVALKRAVEIEPRFFDAQYALGSVSLRLAVLEDNDELLYRADASFQAASILVEEKALSADFLWHRAIVWSSIAKSSGEPSDMKRSVGFFSQAHSRGCCRPDFFNDYANMVVELALAVSCDDLILQAASLYSEALEVSKDASKKEKAVRFFNLGCCYQHLFETTNKEDYFYEANLSFKMATSLLETFFEAWERWGVLHFRGWRIWRNISLLEQTIEALVIVEKGAQLSSVGCATLSQALLWRGVGAESDKDLKKAFDLAEQSRNVHDGDEVHPEPYAALALCLLERGRYFADISLVGKALKVLQEGLNSFPRSVILWHALAVIKWSQADLLEDVSFLQEALLAYSIASRSFLASSSQFFADWGVTLLDLAEQLDDPSLAEEAIKKFEEACEKEKTPLSLYHMGRAYYLLGDVHEDEDCFEKAISLFIEAFLGDDTLLPAIYHIALSYLRLGELTADAHYFAMARRYYEELLLRDPEDEIAWVDYALTLVHLGESTRTENALPREWFQAEEALSIAQKLGLQFASYHKACLCTLMGNYPEAMEALQCALRDGELPDKEEIMEDEWLEPLTRTASFRSFLKELEKNPPADL